VTGQDRITRAFSGPGVKLMAHAVAGYPDAASSARILRALAGSGADFIEAQLPFSDPSADGPSIVEANYRARMSGSGTRTCLGLLAELRRGTEAPILVMSYVNVLYAYGVGAIVDAAARSGVDGFIVPDYPDDEPELGLAEACAAAGMALVPIVAPATSLDRAAALASAWPSPFLYAVTRLGVTGRRTELNGGGLERLKALGARTGKRVAAGFGIRERGQVLALEGYADCAVVGSAIVDAIRRAEEEGRDPAEAAGRLVGELKRG